MGQPVIGLRLYRAHVTSSLHWISGHRFDAIVVVVIVVRIRGIVIRVGLPGVGLIPVSSKGLVRESLIAVIVLVMH